MSHEAFGKREEIRADCTRLEQDGDVGLFCCKHCTDDVGLFVAPVRRPIQNTPEGGFGVAEVGGLRYVEIAELVGTGVEEVLRRRLRE